MRVVIQNDDFKQKLREAILLLCNPVCSSLGPTGHNVLIDVSDEMPFITNDGVTIAKNIVSDDEVLNAILAILKESSLKTNEEVGDGTTTTLVILKALMLGYLDNGVSCDLSLVCDIILSKLEGEKRIPKYKDMVRVASTSANDDSIGSLVAKVFNKIKEREAIYLQESNDLSTYVVYQDGYVLANGAVASSFLDDLGHYLLCNPYVLLIDGCLDSINVLSMVINMIQESNRSLFVMADFFNDEVKQFMVSLNYEDSGKVVLVQSVDYVVKKQEIFEDLMVLTKAKVVANFDEYIPVDVLGQANIIKGDINESIVVFDRDSSLDDYLVSLVSLSNKVKDDFVKKSIKRRIGMLRYGLATIYVGGKTHTERKELLMRYDDALASLSCSKCGVIVGGGLTLLKISDMLSDSLDEVILASLRAPFEQILINSNINSEDVLDIIRESNYSKYYDAKLDCMGLVSDGLVLDSYLVIKKAIETAFSIAKLLLSSNYLVLNIWGSGYQEK